MPGDSNLRSDDDQLHSRTSQFALTFNLQLAVGIPMNHPFTVWIATCKRLVESSTQSTSPVYPIKRVLVTNLHAVFQVVVEFADQRGAPGRLSHRAIQIHPLLGQSHFLLKYLKPIVQCNPSPSPQTPRNEIKKQGIPNKNQRKANEEPQ
jgi:hypothetical protein